MYGSSLLPCGLSASGGAAAATITRQLFAQGTASVSAGGNSSFVSLRLMGQKLIHSVRAGVFDAPLRKFCNPPVTQAGFLAQLAIFPSPLLGIRPCLFSSCHVLMMSTFVQICQAPTYL